MRANTKKMCLSGLFVALCVVLSTYVQVTIGASIRLDLGYAVVMVSSLSFGGLYGCTIAFLARVINDLIFSGTVSVWWAIGSATFAWGIGFVYIHFIINVRKTTQRLFLLALITIVSSVAAFIGIVPVLANLMVGANYGFMLGIGVIAAITDAVVALLIG